MSVPPGSKADQRPGDGRGRPAIFLDRDGTIIEFVHYIADPTRVRLIPGAAGALRRFVDSGFSLVVITNQSAIGRGTITVGQYEAVDAEMRRQLAAEGVSLDGVYYCPEVPGGDDPTIVTHGDRKPGPGLLLRAARELGLDLARSWMIGDMISDALAGLHAGCLGSILVGTGKPLDDRARPGTSFSEVADLRAAAQMILSTTADPSTIRRGETT